ncbi:Transcriptional regulator, LuxR family (plasmid) [Sinorhizobium sojae CCBAU 05684]|uniref:Transcriptional regulator, LuxR family n=1 Tax=Sinorhizobium sojae CCBAU 05684 TaxID=716928 RepID=A0A249PJV0_9HYPH|nr:response regulator transcription factor [Sinorhizobium sojae]ASY66017.1 Transcriptional regulator, LuxR family [Sinorhizobium sojae CCBAU 05684]
MHSAARFYENSALHTLNASAPGDAADETCDRPGTDAALLLLDHRTLDRECLAQCLVSYGVGLEVLAFGSTEEWRRDEDVHPPIAAVLVNIGGRKVTDPNIAGEIAGLVMEFRPTPVVVLADTDELSQILKALECGAKGYIPTTIGFDVCVEAVKLAHAGGIFVPASSVLATHKVIDSGGTAQRPMAGMFTQRQEEVIRELRRGKANKIIAYELNLRESTVKVHIRNIMKKLKATNRTEVAYKLSEMFPVENGARD